MTSRRDNSNDGHSLDLVKKGSNYLKNCFLTGALYIVKPQKTENKIVTKIDFYRQATAKCSKPTLQNVPMRAFCNVNELVEVTCNIS